MKSATVLTLSFLMLLACNSESEHTTEKKGKKIETRTETQKRVLLEAEFSDSGKTYRTGDIISVNLNFVDSLPVEFYTVAINAKTTDTLSVSQNFYEWDTSDAKTGENLLSFEIQAETYKSKAELKTVLLSDIKPKDHRYEVVNVFPHDRQAYTQGLFYKDDYLYEATGLRGESSVRKVNLKSGEVIRSFSVPSEIFGEGITYYDDKIVQISWDSGRGFVYRFSDFKLLQEFRYAGEGWGLEHNNNRLYMTDGSHKIRLLNDQTYSLAETLEVYDDKGPVKYLNELEFIKGKLWANIYRHEKIAIIDPETGKVEGYINLKRLLPMNDYTSQTDVLNGIAYDAQNDRIFVTGKKWPKLFEITVH